MFVCNNGENKILAFHPPADLRELSDERTLTCPYCGQTVFFKPGSQKRPHFAHYVKCDYPYWEPESEEHSASKIYWYNRLKELYPESHVELEYYRTNTGQISDVGIIHPNGSTWAIEIQCTPISEAVWKERHRLYESAGVKDVWILGWSVHHYSKRENYRDLIPHKVKGLEAAIFKDKSQKLTYFDYEQEEIVYMPKDSDVPFLRANFDSFLEGTFLYAEEYRYPGVDIRFSLTGEILTPLDIEILEEEARNLAVQKEREAKIEAEQKRLERARIAEETRIKNKLRPEYIAEKKRKNAIALLNSGKGLWIWFAQKMGITIHLWPDFLNAEIENEEIFNVDRRLWQAHIFYWNVTNGDSKYIPELISKLIFNMLKKKQSPISIDWDYHNAAKLKLRTNQLTGVIWDYGNTLVQVGFLKRVAGDFLVTYKQIPPIKSQRHLDDINTLFRQGKLRVAGNQYVNAETGEIID